MSLVKCYVEIEKYSNIKYEYNKLTKKLEVDRVLKYPYFYPYSYGFIPETLGNDGDELDILIISENKYDIDKTYQCYIIGALIMEDEKGMDEKILVVPYEDYHVNNIKDISDLNKNILEDIEWFFVNYKMKEVHKWSRVDHFVGHDEAIEIYNDSKEIFINNNT